MKKFYYYDSTEIALGDKVEFLVGNNKMVSGYVDFIIFPGTPEAESFDCPEGGVMFSYSCGDGLSHVLMTPPDGEYWEDFYFLGRKEEDNG